MRRRLITPKKHVVGLDLSLRGPAACALPLDWDHDLRKVRTGLFGYELSADASDEEVIERNAQIAHDVTVFCINARATRIARENYAFAASSSSVTKLAELGGVVRHDVMQTMGIAVSSITASRARKVLLQNCPSSGSKKFTVRNVKRLGGPTLKWSEDECDAFVIANCLLMYAGGIAMTFEGTY